MDPIERGPEAELADDAAAEMDSGGDASSQSPAEAIAGTIASHIAGVADWLARAVSPRPLANLYEIHPEARLASPRELGFRFVPVEDIRGTAVAGIAQRGLDFLPLPPFRGENWQARWQRIRDANARLQPLPPVDLVKYEGVYWVVDGHNRVGAALADNAAGLDAMVTELVPMNGRSSEWPTALLPHLGEVGELRAAAAGHRPALGVRVAEQASSEEPGTPRSAPHDPGAARSRPRDRQGTVA